MPFSHKSNASWVLWPTGPMFSCMHNTEPSFQWIKFTQNICWTMILTPIHCHHLSVIFVARRGVLHFPASSKPEFLNLWGLEGAGGITFPLSIHTNLVNAKTEEFIQKGWKRMDWSDFGFYMSKVEVTTWTNMGKHSALGPLLHSNIPSSNFCQWKRLVGHC